MQNEEQIYNILNKEADELDEIFTVTISVKLLRRLMGEKDGR